MTNWQRLRARLWSWYVSHGSLACRLGLHYRYQEARVYGSPEDGWVWACYRCDWAREPR